MIKLKNISIRLRLIFWFSLVVVLSVIFTGWVIKYLVEDTVEKSILKELTASTLAIQTMVETALDVSIRNHLRGIAEKNAAVFHKLHLDVLSGKMELSKAKLLAEEILMSQPIGETGYIYILNGNGEVLIHPYKEMKNKDVSDKRIFQIQSQKKEGYIEYDWKNPGEKEARSKALYMVYFEPWDWIISVSSYREEFSFLFNIDDLRPGIMSFRFGETGYAFILDASGAFIVHPNLTGDIDSLDNEGPWREIHKKMLSMKNGQFTFKWVDPADKTVHEQLVFFHYIPKMDWIVASTAYIDEIQKPMQTLQQWIVLSITIVLLLILPLGFYIGVSITRPINRLSLKMKEATSGNFDIRADESAYGELGQLALHFNTYMDRLKAAQAKLHEEIKERIQAEAQLNLFAKVFENALEGISITDVEGTILTINKAFSDITGYTEEEAIGKNPRILKSDRHDESFYKAMWDKIIQHGHWVGEIWNRRKSGEAYPEILSISAIKNSKGETTHYAAVFHDISDMKSQEELIKHQAYHDALTGLPNRALALDRLDIAIAHSKRQEDCIAVFFLDMDNFKYVNDSLGHTTGDILLQNVAARLKRLVRDQDTVARLGGDEFLIIADGLHSEQDAMDLADRLLEGFKKPFVVNDLELFVTLSIGISFYPNDGKDADTLIKNADAAMYQSKSQGKNSYNMFTSELSERALRRLLLEREFRQALKNREFTVYYQPKVKPEGAIVEGVEALVRWQKREGDIISPGEFIPLAEETGLIEPLGRFVFEESCKAVKEINNGDHPPITVAVNLSPVQFKQDDIVENILYILKDNDLSSSFIELEITEGAMMTDIQATIKKLDTLKEEGVAISIDDFGTGYSSLYYLKNMPISTLKVDRSFIMNITNDQDDAQIVETIILMAKNLGIGVVAEGVETREQLEMLKAFGCELIQGYYYARPMPLDDLMEFLKKSRSE